MNKAALLCFIDTMGKIYFPITNDFLQDAGSTFDFNTRLHPAPYKPVLEKSALVTPTARGDNAYHIVCTLPDGSTITTSNKEYLLPKGTVITCTNPRGGLSLGVPVRYITRWIEIPEASTGG